jgi:hypothetical protein
VKCAKTSAGMEATMEYTVKSCPKCGRELHVPTDTKTCICMFCGETIDLQEKQKLEISQESLSGIEEQYRKALEGIAGFLENKEKYMENFTRNKYSKSFEQYVRIGITIFQPVQRYVSVLEDKRENAVQEVARAMVGAMKEELNKVKTGLLRESKDRVISEYGFFLAIYTVPMILHLKYDISEMLADRLVAEWCSQFPNHKIQKGTFEELQSGFKRKRFCFITTAVCEAMNKADDCYELTAFRNFRDTYMQMTTERQALVEEYYQIAPAIVTLISMEPDAEEKYQMLWQEYLQPCLQDIEKNCPADCEKRYIQMVEKLKKAYGIGVLQYC